MANGHNHLQSPRVRNGEPQPAPTQPPEPAAAKRDLTSWWRQFSKRPAKKDDDKDVALPGIFGVPLIQSIPYANVAISLFNEHGESYIYGYVPIVVAKCGVYLKEKATDVEGIFRLAGSEKRIKELKTAFDTPPRYGKGLDWTGYTVHDAANILRRYFNNLPEPIIPLQHYDPFRQPLRGHQAEAVGHIEGQDPSVGGFDPDAVVRIYQHLIKGLPSLNRQLLLYILDLLAVFAAKADINKMTTHNLAAIFQPGILSHPQHDMSPGDYRLSQDVLIFLIDNQDHFLIGMEGTAVDEGTVKHIESGPSTPQAKTPTTPGRNASGIGRSASNSSAGAESLRKMGGIRRNVSTSSKRSRHSGAIPSPVTPAFATPSSSGVHRSNTLPSKRSPAIGASGPRFTREKSGSSTPGAEEPKSPGHTPLAAEAAAIVASLGHTSRASPAQEATNTAPPPTAEPVADVEQTPIKRAQTMPPQKIDLPQPAPFTPAPQNKGMAVTPALDQIPGAFPLPSPGIIPPSGEATPNATAQAAADLLPPNIPIANARSPQHTPTREKSEFLEGPVDSGATVEASPATRSFTQILAKVAASPGPEGRDGKKPNKLQKKRVISSANPSAHSSTHSLTGADAGVGMTQLLSGQHSPLHPPQAPFAQGYAHSSGSREALPAQYTDATSSRNSGTTLKPSMSPSASFRSHSTATEYSEVDPTEEPKEEKRSFWKAHKRGDSRATPTASQNDLHGSVPGGGKSMSSFGSGSGPADGSRRSLQYDSHQNSDLTTAFGSPPDHEKPEKKGAFDWFHKMRSDHRDRADKRERAKSPPGSSSLMATPQNLRQPQDASTGRGRSMDVPRSTPGGSTAPGASDSIPAMPGSVTAQPRAPPPGTEQAPPLSNSQAIQPQPAESAPPPHSPTTAVPQSVPTGPQTASSPTSAETIQPLPTVPEAEPTAPRPATPNQSLPLASSTSPVKADIESHDPTSPSGAANSAKQ